MITTAFIYFGNALLGFVLAIFPVSTGFPQQFNDAVNYIAGYAGMFDTLVPISTLATAVGVLFSVELIILTFKATKWIFGYVPIVGGRG